MPATNFVISTKFLQRSVYILCLTAGLAACGGGGGSSGGGTTPGTSTYSLSSTFIKGLVTGATCELFEVTAAGARSTSVATGTTANGLVNFGNDIEYQGAAIVECVGGTYTDEASGATLTAPLMRAIVDVDGNGAFVVSPLTEIATQLAETEGNLNSALTTHNSFVASAFGLDLDITEVVPLDLNTIAAVNTASGRYGTVLALISQVNETGARSLSDIVDDLADDLSDDTLSAAALSDLGDAVTDLASSEVAANISDNALANIVASAGIPVDDDQVATDQPNILFILSDDQGVDSSAEYDFSMDPPTTPILSALAAEGVVFENVWATPACSTTRAAILTGKHGVNNGVISIPGNLNEDDEIIYEYLANNAETDNYASAYIGKWHLNNAEIGGQSNPVANGIPYFAGPYGNIDDYYRWDLNIDSSDTAISSTTSTEYNTSELTRLAENWIANQDTPWFLTLAYNAPHAPAHWPDESLHTRTGVLNGNCTGNSRLCFLAMVEAMDTEIGNLLETLSEEERNNTIVIFVGDNGTGNGQRDPLVFSTGEVKGSLFEGGLRVPMIVSGARVSRVNAREDRLVAVTDIYATIAELAGADFNGAINDSISFGGYLTSDYGDNRQYSYSDFLSASVDGWSVRNHSHQLIHDHDTDISTLYQINADNFNRVDVTSNDTDALFELHVEGALIRGELASLVANPSGSALDITDGGENGTYTVRATTCARYVKDYTASVTDEGGNGRYDPEDFTANTSIRVANGVCTFDTDGIPNHNMQDTASFATEVSKQTNLSYQVPAVPEFAESITHLSIGQEQGIYLNGIKIDIFSAACVGVNDERTQCNVNAVTEENEWRFDPMFEANGFGTDSHNAHTQPSGAYHYHGSPNALFDGSGDTESGTVGFAADGFPIYGLYIEEEGVVREVLASYQLKPGNRPVIDLGGSSAEYSEQPYNGAFRRDYEYVEGSGDLDECNGMFRDGNYGYYVTDDFPYIVGCFLGTPDDSFGGQGGAANAKLH